MSGVGRLRPAIGMSIYFRFVRLPFRTEREAVKMFERGFLSYFPWPPAR